MNKGPKKIIIEIEDNKVWPMVDENGAFKWNGYVEPTVYIRGDIFEDLLQQVKELQEKLDGI